MYNNYSHLHYFCTDNISKNGEFLKFYRYLPLNDLSAWCYWAESEVAKLKVVQNFATNIAAFESQLQVNSSCSILLLLKF